MNDLSTLSNNQPIGGVGGLSIMPPSPYSRLGRAVRTSYGGGMLRTVNADVEAGVAASKVAAATNLGRMASAEIAAMTQIESQLKAAIPEASERIEALGNLASLEVANILSSGLGSLRRL